MPDLTRTTPAWSGTPLMDDRGEHFGTLGDLLTDAAGGARWQLVDLGGRWTAVPAQRFEGDDGTFAVPYPRTSIEAAPAIDPDAPDEALLASHFGVSERHAEEVAEVVRSEEEVRITTAAVEHSRVRVRKEVVTEEVDVRVTVRREVLHVEQVPHEAPDTLTPQTAAAHAVDHEIGEEALEIVLHAEVPVVNFAVMPRERVRLARTVVSEPVTVHTPRRVEHVDVERLPPSGDAPR